VYVIKEKKAVEMMRRSFGENQRFSNIGRKELELAKTAKE